MEKKQLTEAHIESVESFLVEELKKEYSRQDPKNLNIPGLEVTLIFIATKVLLPIAVNIAGRMAYDKIADWRKGKIKKADIINEVITAPITAPTIPKEKVIAGIVEDLKNDNISSEKAKELAEKAYEKFKSLK